MKRLLWFAAMLVVLVAPWAHADSIPVLYITQVIVHTSPDYDGDNASFIFTGPGTNITGYGGIVCFGWCSTGPPDTFSPGDSLAPDIGEIYLGFDPFATTFGGKSLNDYISVQDYSKFGVSVLGSFTFPANPTGSTFTGCVPAKWGGSIPVSVGSGEGYHQFILQMPTEGTFCTTWDFDPAGGYTLSQGKFVASTVATVPEPGTLGLIGSGLLGIVGAVLRKRSSLNQDTV
jgi:hypothetical protein